MADGGDSPVSIALSRCDPRLMLWLSPAFPVGAFAYSHGVEWAAQAGWVKDRATLEAWLVDLVRHGGFRNDLILIALAADAVRRGDTAGLDEINALALALQPSAERRLEAAQQGTSFLGTIAAAWTAPGLDGLGDRLGGEIAYPVAVGAVTAAHGIATSEALVAYAIAFLTNLVSAAIRLSVIGQTDGQRVLAALLPRAIEAATLSEGAGLDDIGGAALRSDIASLAHETQYTRLFRS